MKHQITYQNITHEAPLNRLATRLIAGLARHLADFPSESIWLHITVEHQPLRSLYEVTLVLNLPGKTIATKEEGHDARATLHDAFFELERQIEKYKSSLRGESSWKRLARRETIHQEKSMTALSEDREQALGRDIILGYLHTLYNFTRRELASHLAAGDLMPGELTIEDVIDAVVLRAAQEFSQRPSSLSLDRWLMKLTLEHLERELKRLEQERAETVHLEEDVPETPPTEAVTAVEDEIYEFYQPDEDLRLEDLVPAPFVPTPEQILESRDLQRYVNQTLAKLPRPARLAFVLHDVEGLSISEVAEVTGQQDTEVARNLDYAREFLRQKIVESGLAIAS